FFVSRIRRPPTTTLFPYTTLLPISCVCPREPRMAVGGDSVADHHHERVGERLSDRAIRNLEDHDGGSLPAESREAGAGQAFAGRDRKSTRLNSSHVAISYAVFCLKK